MAIRQSAVDKLWNLLFGVIIAVSGGGSMFLAAAYVTPALVGPPVGGSRHGLSALIEFVALFGGLFIGLFIATQVASLLIRRFVDTATQVRWEQEFQDSIA